MEKRTEHVYGSELLHRRELGWIKFNESVKARQELKICPQAAEIFEHHRGNRLVFMIAWLL